MQGGDSADRIRKESQGQGGQHRNEDFTGLERWSIKCYLKLKVKVDSLYTVLYCTERTKEAVSALCVVQNKN